MRPQKKESRPLLNDEEEDSLTVPVIVVMDGCAGRLHEDTRSQGLHKGAAVVISRWPEHATSCIWIGILIALGLFLVAATGIIIAYEGAHMPSCVPEYREKEEAPLHACFLDEIPHEQIDLLAERYPNKTLRIVLFNKNNDSETNSAATEHTHKRKTAGHNRASKSKVDSSNVELIYTDPSAYFHKSILNSVWHKLDTSGLLLSCRALAVWNHGGTAIDMNYIINELIIQCQQQVANNITEDADGDIICDASTISIPEAKEFENFLIGRDGLLLSSLSPCHSFAWDLLFSARVGARTSEDITVDALETFCRGKPVEKCRGIELI